MDYGSEFRSKVLDAWAFGHDVKLDFIPLGDRTPSEMLRHMEVTSHAAKASALK